jgi:glucose/arabinose dehydrogenase
MRIFLTIILIAAGITACASGEVIRPVESGEDSLVAPATPQPSRSPIQIDLVRVAEGFERPTYLTHGGDERLFIIEQPGTIRILQDGIVLSEPFLDIRDLVSTTGNERGLLSMAFESDNAKTGRFYVNYTRVTDGATVVERYQVGANPNLANADSAEVLLVIEQPEANHNGGGIKFGPDGYLYIGTGDGGGAGDRHGRTGNAQNLSTLLGKILRIDVLDTNTYSIPDDNPFVDQDGSRAEIWAYGLRNPWRFSFDRLEGDLYIADVGQNRLEEVNFVPATSQGGENYGWRIMEASTCYSNNDCDAKGLVIPVAEYGRTEGCSVTGGYVYRGEKYPVLDGLYLFGDYCTGKIWALEQVGQDNWQVFELLSGVGRISSFGEDANGELYIVDHAGKIFKITVP